MLSNDLMETTAEPRTVEEGAAVKLPREDGAWYMALTCWLVGWAAAPKPAWEPLLIAIAVVCLLAAAQSLRSARRLWTHVPLIARRHVLRLPLLLLVPAGALVMLLRRVPEVGWVMAMLAPALTYAPLVLAGEERLPVARLLAVAAITAIAPATLATVRGSFGPEASALWAALGGYFLIGALFVMARLRRTAGALFMLALVRLAAPAAAATMFVWGAAHWLLALPFLILAVRAWGVRAGRTAPTDPRRVGKREIVYSVAAGVLVLAGLWAR